MGVRDAVIRTMQMTWSTAWDRIESFFTGKRGKDDRGGQIGECPDLRTVVRRIGGVMKVESQT
jgi:hypothetical protein